LTGSRSGLSMTKFRKILSKKVLVLQIVTFLLGLHNGFQSSRRSLQLSGRKRPALETSFFFFFYLAFLDLNPDTAMYRYYIVPYTYQCCGSGMFIPDPDFYPSRISDPESRSQLQQKKEKGEQKMVKLPFLCHKFYKI
jgi:hypothetical protein